MTNIFKSPDKADLKSRLFGLAVESLEVQGWRVEKVRGSGKSSVRRITKGTVSKTISIRTSQDTWIAFPRTDDDLGWGTLDEVDAVVAASVDSKEDPRFAKIHLIDAKEIRDRLDRAYNARKKAGYKMSIGRGIWISLYLQEASDPVTYVGAGVGLKVPPLAVVPLNDGTNIGPSAVETPRTSPADEPLLTIAEAKRRLAATLGVSESNIKISVEA